MNLHERLIETINQAEAVATVMNTEPFRRNWYHWDRRGGKTAFGRYLNTNHPEAVLRGLAEDRDILRRHVASYEMPTWPPGVPEESRRFLCAGCHGKRYLHDCPEIASVARRHGIDPEAATDA